MCDEDPVEDMLKDLNEHIAALRGRMEVAEDREARATGREADYQKEIARLKLELNQARENTVALVELVRRFGEDEPTSNPWLDELQGLVIKAFQRFGTANPDSDEPMPEGVCGVPNTVVKPRKLRLWWPIIEKSDKA